MCFAAELLSLLIGAQPSLEVPSLYFQGPPQQTLFPDAAARPSSATVAAFLKDRGIGYIYADAKHPNSLVDDAIPIVSIGGTELSKIP
jgi:hypothetical protein